MTDRPRLSVYVIAFNEAEKIKDALQSVLWADEILLIDSFSQDDTAKIAQEMGVRVIQHTFVGFGDLRNKAISLCSGDWILSIDADERCTDEAKQEIVKLIADQSAKEVYYVPRKNYFMGRWIKYSGWYPNYRQPQLFRNGKLRYDDQLVHEGFILTPGATVGFLKNGIKQIPFREMSELLRKADRYSSLGALKIKQKSTSVGIAFFHGFWAFLKHYFFKLGFMDGGPGLVIAFANFEGTFYRYLKAHELKNRSDWEKLY